MTSVLRGALAIVVGLIVGGMVNMALVMVSPLIIPPPEGVDVTDMESLRNSMHLFKAHHFVFPFLAHALGTLVGAFLAASIAVKHKSGFALGIGVFFLIGGLVNAFLIPAPLWFEAVDLVAAYLPMSWLGAQIALRKTRGTS